MDLVKSLAHPGELWALLRFKFGGGKELVMPSASQVRPLVEGCSKAWIERLIWMCLFPGFSDGHDAEVLRAADHDQPELCSSYTSTGRGAEVSII